MEVLKEIGFGFIGFAVYKIYKYLKRCCGGGGSSNSRTNDSLGDEENDGNNQNNNVSEDNEQNIVESEDDEQSTNESDSQSDDNEGPSYTRVNKWLKSCGLRKRISIQNDEILKNYLNYVNLLP